MYIPTSPVSSTSTPVSSATSRTAASAIDSPTSIPPPGNAHSSLLGAVVPVDDGFEAQWTDAAGEKHRERLRTYAQAMQHATRHQAGGLRFHNLRHSYATALVDDGVPPNMVQRVMGHERSSTTLDLYTRRADNGARILEALDDPDDEDPDDGAAPVLAPV